MNTRISLDALTVLVAIDNHGSFGAAAKVLHRVPSALTYTVQKLETDLGIEIFDRSGHRAKMTPAGRELLREGRNLLRAANELEARAKRAAGGWESLLRIALDNLIPVGPVLELIKEFDELDSGTRVQISKEAWGGTWDALIWDRADLSVGASGETPSGGGYSKQRIGSLNMNWACSPDHPLAQIKGTIREDDLMQHRAVVTADTSRQLQTRDIGVVEGQNRLTVFDLQQELEALRQGLGIGTLPAYLAQQQADYGNLKLLDTENPLSDFPIYVVWKPEREGRATEWFIKRLRSKEFKAKLMGETET